METVEEIINYLGGDGKVAVLVGLHQNAVTFWRKRQRIPAKYWDKLIEASSDKLTRDILGTACKYE